MPSFAQLLNDRYKFVMDLNKGSYGVVSLYEDVEHNNELVAIKCINKLTGYDEAQHEIAIHNHLGVFKYISKLIGHFQDDDKTYLVMEYHSGGDIYEAIRAGRGPRDQGTVYEFMCQLIDAVRYCHSKGIYHRDIKPENILIASDGSIKLADFGLASKDKTTNEFGVGSERYMAPELFDQHNVSEYDAEQADIWSIGIVLLNVLFGRNPFIIASHKDKLFLDFAANRESLFDIFPTLTSDTFSVLRHCLTIDPDNRSLSKMRLELHNVENWTTDDEYDRYNLQEQEVQEVEEEEFNFDDIIILDKAENEVIITTTNRQPLRTPTILDQQQFFYESNESTNPWNRTMQFTPPASSGILHNRLVKAKENSQLSKSMMSISESDQECEEESQSSKQGSFNGEDVFLMDEQDEFNNSFSKMNLRNSSDDSSLISSAPSLVRSEGTVASTTISRDKIHQRFTEHYSSSLSKLVANDRLNSTNQLGSSVPNYRDFLKFGKSWSDMVFEEEEEEQEFLDFTKTTSSNLVSPGAVNGFSKVVSNTPW